MRVSRGIVQHQHSPCTADADGVDLREATASRLPNRRNTDIMYTSNSWHRPWRKRRIGKRGQAGKWGEFKSFQTAVTSGRRNLYSVHDAFYTQVKGRDEGGGNEKSRAHQTAGTGTETWKENKRRGEERRGEEENKQHPLRAHCTAQQAAGRG